MKKNAITSTQESFSVNLNSSVGKRHHLIDDLRVNDQVMNPPDIKGVGGVRGILENFEVLCFPRVELFWNFRGGGGMAVPPRGGGGPGTFWSIN